MIPRFTRPPSPARRPRVLLVDDHPRILTNVSALLSHDFDVAGVATDGMQAVDVAHRVNPDAIVLDVEMPGLDGFQTFRALEHAGLGNTPVVFLSMHHADSIVGEAFRYGARGYVLKPRVGRDLVTALDQALLGRMFVPSLNALLLTSERSGHALQVHDDVGSSADEIAAFFDLALQRGDATCVIATAEFRKRLAHRLDALGWNVRASSGHKRYRAVDAAEALDRFMRDGSPDRYRLAEIARELEQYRCEVSDEKTSRVVIFGAMAPMLSADGNQAAAISLERHWSEITRGLPFLTLCGYGLSCFHDAAPTLWSDVCDAHSALSHARDV